MMNDKNVEKRQRCKIRHFTEASCASTTHCKNYPEIHRCFKYHYSDDKLYSQHENVMCQSDMKENNRESITLQSPSV